MRTKLLVTKITAGSQADKLGILTGDVLESYDGKVLWTNRDLQGAVHAVREADKSQVTLVTSRGGVTHSYEVTTDPLGVECLVQETSSTNAQQGIGQTKTNYGVARFVAGFVSLVGWILFIAGIGFALYTLQAILQSPYGRTEPAIVFAGMLPGLGIAFSGLLSVMGSQMTLAMLDTADHARAIRSRIESN